MLIIATNINTAGKIVSDDLRWNLNTSNIVKKANARMGLLRRVTSFRDVDPVVLTNKKWTSLISSTGVLKP